MIFTNDEIEYIKKNYENSTLKKIASDLNKNPNSVYRAILKFGIKKQNHKKWTEEDRNFLRENYINMTSEEMSKILNRTINSINTERDRLGLVRHPSWTKEEVDFLKNNYDKMQHKDIGIKLGKTTKAVTAKCFELNLYKKEKPWEEWEIKFVKDNYMEMTKAEIADILGRTCDAIQVKANRMGMKKSPYCCDYRYFSEINTEEKAYWLGFLASDGWTSKNKESGSGVIGITLQYGDINHLRKFNKAISGNYKITDRWRSCKISTKDKEKKHHCCEIRVFSATMCDDLYSIGLTNNKTYDGYIPSIDKELIRHYVRGYFDGDGTLCYTNKSFKVCFTTASEKICDGLTQILDEQGISSNKYSYVNDFDTTIYKVDIIKKEDKISFLKWIYNDNNISLDRKYKKFIKIISDDENTMLRDGLAV